MLKFYKGTTHFVWKSTTCSNMLCAGTSSKECTRSDHDNNFEQKQRSYLGLGSVAKCISFKTKCNMFDMFICFTCSYVSLDGVGWPTKITIAVGWPIHLQLHYGSESESPSTSTPAGTRMVSWCQQPAGCHPSVGSPCSRTDAWTACRGHTPDLPVRLRTLRPLIASTYSLPHLHSQKSFLLYIPARAHRHRDDFQTKYLLPL